MIFSVVKRYFDRKIYGKEDVRKFVKSGKLTAEEFQEITGESY